MPPIPTVGKFTWIVLADEAFECRRLVPVTRLENANPFPVTTGGPGVLTLEGKVAVDAHPERRKEEQGDTNPKPLSHTLLIGKPLVAAGLAFDCARPPCSVDPTCERADEP